MCDVYVYEHVTGGWTTHVAGGKREREPVPGDDWGALKRGDHEAFGAAHKATMDDLANIGLIPIDLPSAGKTFSDATPGECADRLEHLREEGFRVPQYAIDELRAEQTDRFQQDTGRVAR